MWGRCAKARALCRRQLDGRIAGPGGEFDFFPQGNEQQAAAYSTWMNTLHPETLPTTHRTALGVADAPDRRFDTVVMGLGTYRPALDNGITSPYAHDAVGGIGRTEHEVAEQSQLCVKLLVVPGDAFWFGHAVGRVRARTVETALSRGTRRSGRRPRW